MHLGKRMRRSHCACLAVLALRFLKLSNVMLATQRYAMTGKAWSHTQRHTVVIQSYAITDQHLPRTQRHTVTKQIYAMTGKDWSRTPRHKSGTLSQLKVV